MAKQSFVEQYLEWVAQFGIGLIVVKAAGLGAIASAALSLVYGSYCFVFNKKNAEEQKMKEKYWHIESHYSGPRHSELAHLERTLFYETESGARSSLAQLRSEQDPYWSFSIHEPEGE